MNAMGLKMINLLPLPNDIHNPQPGQYNTSNSALRNAAAAQPHEHHAPPRRGRERQRPRQSPVHQRPRGQHQQQSFCARVGDDEQRGPRAGFSP
jgi:hypothetical protein